MTTLYDMTPEEWDRIEASGKPSLKEMSKLFYSYVDMDRALGRVNTTRKYAVGGNPSRSTEDLARFWLARYKANGCVQPPLELTIGQTEAAPHGVVGEPAPNPAAAPDEKSTFLVVAERNAAEKVKKLMTVLGCEFVEV